MGIATGTQPNNTKTYTGDLPITNRTYRLSQPNLWALQNPANFGTDGTLGFTYYPSQMFSYVDRQTTVVVPGGLNVSNIMGSSLRKLRGVRYINTPQ